MDTRDRPDTKDAEDRTDDEHQVRRTRLSEDQTLMGMERTYGGWMRTGLTALVLALGFQSVLRDYGSGWQTKAVASLFIIYATIAFIIAHRQTVEVLNRVDPHSFKPVSKLWLSVMTGLSLSGAATMAGALWLFDWRT